jgi:putative ABC transport system substrate-binding protein
MQFHQLKRREFITLIGSAAGWPLTARAQQHAMPAVGFLSSNSRDKTAHYTVGFSDGLSEAGFVEGRNVTVEYRWAETQLARLPALALAPLVP